jgi:hypothetical protein
MTKFLNLNKVEDCNIWEKIIYNPNPNNLNACSYGQDFQDSKHCSHYMQIDDGEECSFCFIVDSKCYCEIQPINK